MRDGTDNTFDPAEIAGFTFIISDPLEDGFGFISFDALVNSTDMGSTGSDLPFSETVAQGGTGIEEDFTWNVSTAGVLTLTFADQETVTVTRAGGSTRAISVVLNEPGFAARAITLLKPQPLTEIDLSGALITQSGASTGVHTFTSPAGTEQITFTSDGTVSSTGTGDGPWVATWSIGDLSPNSLRIIDGAEPTLAPNTWTLLVLLDGSITEGGSLFVGDAIFTGLAQDGEPNLVWQAFFFASVAPPVF